MFDTLFGWWQYDFMRNAFVAVLLIMPLFALLGTLVVNNGMAFFSDALGHSALTGVGIGVLLGFTDTNLVMIAFAVVFALLMNRIRHSRLSSTDTVIGVFSSCGVALGLVILSRGSSFSKYQNLLIGDILSISRGELVVLAGALVVVVLLWLLCFNSPACGKPQSVARPQQGDPGGVPRQPVCGDYRGHRDAGDPLGGAADHQRDADPARGRGTQRVPQHAQLSCPRTDFRPVLRPARPAAVVLSCGGHPAR